MAEDIIVPVVLFLTVGASIFFFLRARTKERLACIEKGINVMPAPGKPRDSRRKIFTLGLFMVGLGIGFLLGNLLHENFGFEKEPAFFSMLLLFGGISLVISNFVKFKKEE